jgi:hypothetical protein
MAELTGQHVVMDNPTTAGGDLVANVPPGPHVADGHGLDPCD